MNIANFWKQKPANQKLEDLYKDTVDSQDFQDFKAMQMKDSRNGKKVLCRQRKNYSESFAEHYPNHKSE